MQGLHHLALRTTDVRRLAAFYRDVLELEELNRSVDEVGLRSVWLGFGSSILMLERSESPGKTPSSPFEATSPSQLPEEPNIYLFAFAIAKDQRASWKNRLDAVGASRRESAHSLFASDPDGNRFALSHWPHPIEDSER